MIRLDFELHCATARLYVFYWFFDYALQPLVSKSRFVNVIYLVLDSTASVLRLWTLPFNSSCSANMGVDDLLSCTCTQVIPPTLRWIPQQKRFFMMWKAWRVELFNIIQGANVSRNNPKSCTRVLQQHSTTKCWFLTSSKAREKVTKKNNYERITRHFRHRRLPI